MKKIFVILSAVISLFLIGCATTGGSSKTGAKGTTPSQICGEWKIQSLTGFENAEHFGATLSVFANEDEEFSLNGYSGVNSYLQIWPILLKLFQSETILHQQK